MQYLQAANRVEDIVLNTANVDVYVRILRAAAYKDNIKTA